MENGDTGISLGTATLIYVDRTTGYLLSAAHIFDDNGDLSRRYSQGESIRLIRWIGSAGGGTTVEYPGTLLRKRANKDEEDLAIIRADLGQGWSDSQKYPNLFLGQEYGLDDLLHPSLKPQETILIGFPNEDRIPRSHGLMKLEPSQELSEPRKGFTAQTSTGSDVEVISEEQLRNGVSGALAVTLNGYAYAVLKGGWPKKRDAAGMGAYHYRFTPVSTIPSDWLRKLTPVSTAAKWFERLKARKLTRDQKLEFARWWPNTVELSWLIHKVKELIAQGPKIGDYERQVLICLATKNDLQWAFVGGLDNFGLYVNVSDKKAGAERAGEQSAELSERGYSEGAAGSLKRALALYAAVKEESDFTIGSQNQAVAYFDYGRALEKAVYEYPELKIDANLPIAKYNRAIELDAKYADPHFRLAGIAAQSGQYETAIASERAAIEADATAKGVAERNIEYYSRVSEAARINHNDARGSDADGRHGPDASGIPLR